MLWSNLGINVGDDINFNGAANWPSDAVGQAQVNSDLDYLFKLGFTRFRVAVAGTSNAQGLSHVEYVTQQIKARGGYVISGLAQPGSFHITDETAFESDLVTQAAWAQANNVDEFQIGNEWEINISSDFTEASIYTYVQTLPAKVKAAGFTGIINTSVSQNHFSTWQSSGIGNFDKLGLDIYGANQSEVDFHSQINSFLASFGSQGFLSEWGIDNTWPPTYSNGQQMSEDDIAIKVAKYLAWLKANVTVPCYTFCWRFDGTGVQDHFAYKLHDQSFRLAWCSILGGRRFLTL